MNFQKCPKCDGCGMVSGLSFDPVGCIICNGFGVINEQTGEPLYQIVGVGSLGTRVNIFYKNLKTKASKCEVDEGDDSA